MSSRPDDATFDDGCSSDKGKNRSIVNPSSRDVSVSAAKRWLWDEMGQGLGNVLANVGSTWYGDESVYYTRERERLEKYLPPFYYGVTAAVFLFVGFRITGQAKVKQWRRRVWDDFRQKRRRRRGTPSESGLSSVVESMQTSAAIPPRSQPQPGMGYLETKRITDREQALQSMKLITDFLVSISVGFSGTLFLLEAQRNDMRTDYEEAPLFPGRSVVAEQMCPGILRLYHDNVSVRQVLRRNEQSAPALQDRNLTSFAIFLKNCQKRVDYEAGIRNERGMGKDEPVVVPYSGI